MLAELEVGRLAGAFHLESDGSRRQMVRVWRLSAMAWLAGQAPPAIPLPAMLAEILPERRTWFTVSELSIRWSLGRTLLMSHLRRGCLTMAPGSPWGIGAGNSPRVTRASAAAFLARRQWS
jgi:hypothetical protein